MSDTKTLIKYVRDRLNDGPNITFGKPTVCDLVEALESAEAIAKDNSEARTAAYMSGKYDGRKEAESNVARLTKERDWLADKLAEQNICRATHNKDKTISLRAIDAEEWKEAARRAVAAGEG